MIETGDDMNDDTPEPRIRDWYRNEQDQIFRVVAINDGDGTIEVQMQQGDIEEIDSDDWADWALEAVDEPEDWSAAFDDLDPEQIDEADSAMSAYRPGSPLDDSAY